MRLRTVEALVRGEEGHATAGIGTLIAGVGAILLAIGAAGDDVAWLAVTGGIVLAVGIMAAGFLHHAVVDYDIYARLEKLEK
jgi:hypothetical protein